MVVAPSCAGQNSPWPIISPSSSNTAHEKSSASLKIGEYAVFFIASPISRETVARKFAVTVMVTGSTTVLPGVVVAISSSSRAR